MTCTVATRCERRRESDQTLHYAQNDEPVKLSCGRSSWRLDVSAWAPGVYHARVMRDHPLAGADLRFDAVAFTVVR